MKVFIVTVRSIDGCIIKFTIKAESILKATGVVLNLFNQEKLGHIGIKEIDRNGIKGILNSIYGLNIFDTDSVKD